MKTLAVWSFETRQTRTYSLPMRTSGIAQLTWSSDGRSIYAWQGDQGRSGLYRLNLVTGAVEAIVPVDSGVFPLSRDTTFVGWSPDATRLYKKVNPRQGGSPATLIEHRLRITPNVNCPERQRGAQSAPSPCRPTDLHSRSLPAGRRSEASSSSRRPEARPGCWRQTMARAGSTGLRTDGSCSL